MEYLADARVDLLPHVERKRPHHPPGQTRLVDKLLREVQAARVGNRAWSRSQMLEKQATKVARANSKPFGERLHSAVLQSALADQAQSPRDCIGSSQPGGRSGRAFRPATQTWAETCLRRGGSGWKVANIPLLCMRRRTNRPAINSAGKDTNKELSVEARVTRQPSLRTHLPIQFHFRPKRS